MLSEPEEEKKVDTVLIDTSSKKANDVGEALWYHDDWDWVDHVNY